MYRGGYPPPSSGGAYPPPSSGGAYPPPPMIGGAYSSQAGGFSGSKTSFLAFINCFFSPLFIYLKKRFKS